MFISSKKLRILEEKIEALEWRLDQLERAPGIASAESDSQSMTALLIDEWLNGEKKSSIKKEA